jgi:hypothetical protein
MQRPSFGARQCSRFKAEAHTARGRAVQGHRSGGDLRERGAAVRSAAGVVIELSSATHCELSMTPVTPVWCAFMSVRVCLTAVGESSGAQLLSPHPYLVRVYCLDAKGVQPLDDNTSDPFLKVKLGNHKIDDQENYISATVEPNFFRYDPPASAIACAAVMHARSGMYCRCAECRVQCVRDPDDTSGAFPP